MPCFGGVTHTLCPPCPPLHSATCAGVVLLIIAVVTPTAPRAAIVSAMNITVFIMVFTVRTELYDNWFEF